MDEADNEKYKSCMPLVTPMRETYSIERCSKHGYLKIMLFYYFFELTKQMNIRSINGPAIQSLLAMPEIAEVDVHLFDELKPHIKTDWFGYELRLGHPTYYPEIQERLLRKLFRRGLYFELGLNPLVEEEHAEEEKNDHIVLIVGLNDGTLIIKNSWDEATSNVPFTEVIELEGQSFVVDELYFMFPHDFGEYDFDCYDAEKLYAFIESIVGGKKKEDKVWTKKKSSSI